MLFEWRSEKIQKKKSRCSDSAKVDGRGSGGVSLNDLLTCFFFSMAEPCVASAARESHVVDGKSLFEQTRDGSVFL